MRSSCDFCYSINLFGSSFCCSFQNSLFADSCGFYKNSCCSCCRSSFFGSCRFCRADSFSFSRSSFFCFLDVCIFLRGLFGYKINMFFRSFSKCAELGSIGFLIIAGRGDVMLCLCSLDRSFCGSLVGFACADWLGMFGSACGTFIQGNRSGIGDCITAEQAGCNHTHSNCCDFCLSHRLIPFWCRK